MCNPAECGNMEELLCGNCVDDDGDGLVDAADPQCLGPCDNDEEEFASGMAPANIASCNADCYFDLNSGPGDDRCRWDLSCDPLSPTGLPMCEFSETANCSLNNQDACRERCRPLTPNGCDCFGCCEIPSQSGHFVWLGSEPLRNGDCDAALLDGPDSCPRCTPVDDCENTCEDCELCVGRDVNELPPSCGTGALPACSDGQQACNPALGFNCSDLEYCITGCCAPLPR